MENQGPRRVSGLVWWKKQYKKKEIETRLQRVSSMVVL